MTLSETADTALDVPYAEVIGDPVAHSLSPVIHKHWLELSRQSADYRRYQVRTDALPDYFTRRRHDPNWRGCNITIPHKIAALAHVDTATDAAQALGAINMVTRNGDSLIGDNSDHLGIADALAALPASAAHAVLIGAGGAARAALYHLTQRGMGCTVLARRPDRAATLREPFPDITDILALDDRKACLRALAHADVLINASPAGMMNQPPQADTVIDAMRQLPATALVFDMVYAPLHTPLLVAARSAGLATSDGLTMLIGQAAKAFAGFYGVAPDRAQDAHLRAALLA